jgi:hypothetical protein
MPSKAPLAFTSAKKVEVKGGVPKTMWIKAATRCSKSEARKTGGRGKEASASKAQRSRGVEAKKKKKEEK